MESPIEKLERLSNSRMQRLSMKITKWCTAHRLPRVHGCVWDRHCRYCGAPRRIEVFWGRHGVWVDLPGHDKATMLYRGPIGNVMESEAEQIPASWQIWPQFGRWSHPKEN